MFKQQDEKIIAIIIEFTKGQSIRGRLSNGRILHFRHSSRFEDKTKKNRGGQKDEHRKKKPQKKEIPLFMKKIYS